MPRIRIASVLLLVAACGGGSSQKPVAEPTPPGQAHATPPPNVAAPDVAPPAIGESISTPAPATQPSTTEEKPAMRPPAPAEGFTFELKNGGDADLLFSTTKGWQPVLFAYTGKPPKAKSVMLFPSYCTASCDSGDAVCPVCAQPKNKKEELAMAKSETAASGSSVKVPWDGKVFAYEKAPGKKKCKCWRKVDPAPDSYTIKACGLRPSKEPGKPSKPVCTETQVNLGGPDAPRTITLDFAK